MGNIVLRPVVGIINTIPRNRGFNGCKVETAGAYKILKELAYYHRSTHRIF